MAMDITGLGSTHTGARSRVNEQQNASSPTGGNAGAQPSVSPSSSDTVKISDAAQALQNAELELQSQPDVDSDRVAEIKKAIDNGEYEIDAGRVADRMLAFDELFS